MRVRSERARGAALTSTMVFVLIALLALMGVFGEIRELSAVEESLLRVPGDGDGVAEALGDAVARMHTGVPPESPYVCRLDLRSSDGDDVLSFQVTHTQLAPDRWTLAVAAGGAASPKCPTAFDDTCPLGG
jgi:hypothetical protein